MAGIIKTTDDLVSDVRSLLDEENQDSVSTENDILPALNRAQDFATDILARQYETPLLAKTIIDTTNNQQEYDIPEDAYAQRLEKIEVEVNGLFYPVTRIDFRHISLYETQGTNSIAYYYVIIGRKIRILPTNNGTYNLRAWYLQDPLPLRLSQGRITRVNTTDQYILVDQAGGDITTESDQLKSYINFIDGTTGKIKGSMQIKNIQDNKITLKTSPTRTTVLNQTIDTDLGAFTDENGQSISVEADDYISVVEGTCVPYLKKPLSNFLIQFAVADIRRKLGGPAELEERILDKFEKQVERQWVGQEQSIRVTKRNDKWDLPIRRYWGYRGR
jgi:hypothetical protein